MLRKSVVLVALLALLTACSKGEQPAPASAPATGQAPASTAPANTSPTGSSPTPTAPAPTPAPAGAQRYELVKAQSKASYVVTELLAGATVRNEAIGTTSEITGELVLDAQGKVQPATFTVDMKSLTSDRPQRDTYIRSNGLESNKYPTATFGIKEIKGSPTFKGAESFELVGPMKVKETERTVTWKVASTVQDGNIQWKATLQTRLTEWGISPPVLLVRSVAEVDDPFKIEVTLLFKPVK